MKTPQGRSLVAALKPLITIVAFTALGVALLVSMDALGSGTRPVNWSRLLYGAGATVLFLVLAFRARRKAPREDLTKPGETVFDRPDEDDDAELTMEQVRRRIQERKRGK